ncbi:hypothetical protein NMG60_11029407 [Bertholletia excelsa]
MASCSAFLRCFIPSSLLRASRGASVEKPAGEPAEQKKNKSETSGAPIVVSYFPVNSTVSRL